MKRINSPEELLAEASWFDLQNYEICKDLSPKEWAGLLASERLTHLIIYWKTIDHPDFWFLNLCAASWSKTFRDRQLLALKDRTRIDDLSKVDANKIADSTAKNTPLGGIASPYAPVRPLTWGKSQRQPTQLPEDSESLYYDEVMRHYQTAQLTIDLSARDAELQESFMSLIAEYRRRLEIPNPKPCNINNFQNLSEYKVLPYLHLRHWAATNEIDVKPRIYSWVLFGAQRSDRFISETLSPLAGRSLESGFISGLLELDKET